ncbi:MAG: hypothetical protein BGN87_00360 [Rhizobiales bacterium 65-79]|nr:MAG: hypothetical protein BGN87_00360 [Rhizobiales bacterium 65-79]
MIAVDPLGTIEDVLDRRRDQLGKFEFGADGDLGRRDLCVAAALAIGLAAEFDCREDTRRRRIVAEDVERVLAGVEAAGTASEIIFLRAAFYIAFVAIGLTDGILEALAAPVGVEALVGGDRLRIGSGGGLLGAGHGQSFRGLRMALPLVIIT